MYSAEKKFCMAGGMILEDVCEGVELLLSPILQLT